MNRQGLVLIGAAVAILGYAVLYSGMTTLNPKLSPSGKAVSIIDALIPGRVKAPTTSAAGTAGGPSRRAVA